MGSMGAVPTLSAAVADGRAVATRAHHVAAAPQAVGTAQWRSRQRARQPPAHLVNERDHVVGEEPVRSASEAGVVRGVDVGLGCCYSLDVAAKAAEDGGPTAARCSRGSTWRLAPALSNRQACLRYWATTTSCTTPGTAAASALPLALPERGTPNVTIITETSGGSVSRNTDARPSVRQSASLR